MGDYWSTMWGTERWGVFTRPPEEPRVAPELVALVREAGTAVPNAEAPGIPMEAIVSDDLQTVVDLTLASQYRANVAQAMDTLIFGDRTGEPLGFLGAARSTRVNPFWTEEHGVRVIQTVDDAFMVEVEPVTREKIVEAYNLMMPGGERQWLPKWGA
jgi:hypothetical protein